MLEGSSPTTISKSSLWSRYFNSNDYVGVNGIWFLIGVSCGLGEGNSIRF